MPSGAAWDVHFSAQEDGNDKKLKKIRLLGKNWAEMSGFSFQKNYTRNKKGGNKINKKPSVSQIKKTKKNICIPSTKGSAGFTVVLPSPAQPGHHLLPLPHRPQLLLVLRPTQGAAVGFPKQPPPPAPPSHSCTKKNPEHSRTSTCKDATPLGGPCERQEKHMGGMPLWEGGRITCVVSATGTGGA